MAIRTFGGAAAAVFAPLDTLSRSEQVERRLTDAIVLGLIPVGYQLPGEAELAGLLGVSTVTVREALSGLRRQLLIETRRGRGGGSFALAPTAAQAETFRARLRVLSTAQLRDLGDRYAAVAGAAARLAALRATSVDVARLERAHESLVTSQQVEERRRAESHFHIEVAAVSQSPLLFREEVSVQAEIGPLLWFVVGHEDEAYVRNVARARGVLDAIMVGDGDLARALTEERFAEVTALLVEARLNLLEEA